MQTAIAYSTCVIERYVIARKNAFRKRFVHDEMHILFCKFVTVVEK